MKKWLKRLGIVVIGIFIVFMLVFYRRDLSEISVKQLYSTDQSHFVELSIESLSGEELDIDIHYMDIGVSTDPVIVLLHGAFSSSHTFIPWATSLSELGYRIILMDLPYFGLSGSFIDSVTSYRRSAAVVYALMNTLGINHIHMGGNSLGGAVAWYFASEYPEATNSLLLIDAVPPTLEQRSIHPWLKNPFVSGILSQFTPRFLLKQILKTAYGDSSLLDDETVDRYYDILRKENTRKHILMNTTEFDDTLTDRMSLITSPVYIMWGEKDTWIPMEAYDYFVDDLNIPFENQQKFTTLGHLPMEESPTTVTYYIVFLNRLD